MEAGDSENICPTSPVFAVYFPEDIYNSPRTLYSNLKDAAKFANSPEARKQGARFRRFDSPAIASAFFDNGTPTRPPPPTEPVKKPKTASDPVVPYPSVSRIDMNKLKKVIETDNLVEFLVMADTNPRFLVNVASDTAAIVQEGFRYNSLHIAARTGATLVAEHILKFVADAEYLCRLYGTSPEDAAFRRGNILGSYVNTPDKGNGDTPLHIAAKFGHVEVARIICNYKETDRALKNKNGERAVDAACARFSGEGKASRESELRTILNQHFVALYRSPDHVIPPRFLVCPGYPPSTLGNENYGTPSSFDSPVSSRGFSQTTPTRGGEASSPAAWAGPASPMGYTSPLAGISSPTTFSPLLSSYVLAAVAGPFDGEAASTEFMRRWRNQDRDLCRRDFDKGAEKVGREIASSVGVPYAETWPVWADEPVNLRTTAGLEALEGHLRRARFGSDANREIDEADEFFEDAPEEMYESPSGFLDDSLASLTGRLGGLKIDDASFAAGDSAPLASELNGEASVEEEDEEEEDMDEFHTPPSSPAPVFLDGNPTKIDAHLHEVLSSLPADSLAAFPLIRRFHADMDKITKEERSKWPSSMASPRPASGSAKGRFASTPSPARTRLPLKQRRLEF